MRNLCSPTQQRVSTRKPKIQCRGTNRDYALPTMGVKVLTSALVMMVPAVASAAHPLRPIQPAGVAQRYQFVGAPGAKGRTLARQVVPASNQQVAQSRVIYLNHDP